MPEKSSRSEPGTITLTARSPESLIMGKPLPYPPRTPVLPPDPAAFEYWWKMLLYAFELPDPVSGPRIPVDIYGDNLAVLRRYVGLTSELAESSVMNGASGYTVHVDRETGETVDETFARQELLRGFSALFRQFYSNEERASFNRVNGLLRQYALTVSDDASKERDAVLRAWGRAARRLRGKTADVIVRERLGKEGRYPYTPIYGDDQSPELLISAYNYGEYLHWGEKAAVLEEWSTDPFMRAHHQFRVLGAMIGLAHLYIGFGQVVSAMVPTSCVWPRR